MYWPHTSSAQTQWEGIHAYFLAHCSPELLEPDEQPVICRYFGCGHKMSLFEQLHGQYCANHQVSERKKPAEQVMAE